MPESTIQGIHSYSAGDINQAERNSTQSLAATSQTWLKGQSKSLSSFQTALTENTRRRIFNESAEGDFLIKIDDDKPEDLDKPEKLRAWQLFESAKRKEDTKDTQRKEIYDGLSTLSAPEFTSSVKAIEDTLPDGKLKGKIGITSLELAERLGETQKYFDKFMVYRQRMKNAALAEKVADWKGNLFGSSPKANIARATLNAVVTVSAGVAIQMATVQALGALLRENPDQLPSNEIEKALSNLNSMTTATSLQDTDHKQISMVEHQVANMTPQEVISTAALTEAQLDKVADDISQLPPETLNKLIEEYAKPGSAYIDEANATLGEIVSADASIGLARSAAYNVSDNATESNLRERKLKNAMEVDAPSTTTCQKGLDGLKAAIKPQLIGFFVATGVTALATGPSQAARGVAAGKIGEDIGKAAGYATLSSGINLGIEGIRPMLPTKNWTPAEKQALKATMRTFGRVALQYLKTAFSLAVASPGSFPGSKAWNLTAMMTGAVNGAAKDAISATVQTLTEQNLPPDEAYSNSLPKTINVAATMSEVLQLPELREKLCGGRHEAELQKAQEIVQTSLSKIHEAASLKDDSPGIQRKWTEFRQAVDDGPTSAQLSEVVILPPTNPVQPQGDFELQSITTRNSERSVIIDMPKESESETSDDVPHQPLMEGMV